LKASEYLTTAFSEPGFANPVGSPLRKQGEPLRAEVVEILSCVQGATVTLSLRTGFA